MIDRELTDRELIEEHCNQEGLAIDGWTETEDGTTAALGRWVVSTPDYEDDGLYQGDEGALAACVVGSQKYNNRRVSVSLTADGCDCGIEVRDMFALDAAA